MKTLKVNAFTDINGNGGNPAGVVLDAQTLDSPERQKIAAILGHSETAFHHFDEFGNEHLEFFTPTKRINNCGHATVATFGALSFDRPDGDYSVKISGQNYKVRIKNGMIGLRQEIKNIQDATLEILSKVSASLNLNDNQINNLHLIDNGVQFLVFELTELDTLINLKPNMEAIKRLSINLDLVGYYITVKDTENGDHYFSRMFGPAYGIPEESATGMGAICFMGLKNKQDSMDNVKITQGKGMNPSGSAELYLNVENGYVWVSGRFLVTR